MLKKVYTIGSVTFQVDSSSEIEKVYPFSLFKSKKTPQIFYLIKKRLPEVSEQMFLLYEDNRNRVYDNGEKYFRYIGEFGDQREYNRNQSCLIYSRESYHQFDVYFPHECKFLNEMSIFNAIGLEQVLGYYKQIILHSSYIIYNGMGIVFSAPSQTGKSTQARLWKENVPGVEIINGDRSVIGEVDEKIIVFGIPFCGSSEISHNQSSLLKCVIVLRQGKDNALKRLSKIEAFKYLYSECSVPVWDKDALTGIMTSLENIVSKVPVYLYSCVADKSAVDKLLKVLMGEEIV